MFLFVPFNSRFPSLPVNGAGQLKMRRQSSELFLDGVLSPPCQRMGAMVAFQCFDDFKRSVFILKSHFSFLLVIGYHCYWLVSHLAMCFVCVLFFFLILQEF